MDTPSLRRQPTLPMDPPNENPPRKILKAKRRFTSRPSETVSLVSSTSSTSSLIKPSLSKKVTSITSMSSKRSVTSSDLSKVPSLTKKASITKEISDIATTAIALDSGSHIGKTGVITEDDIGEGVEITEVDHTSPFSETGDAVVSSLRKSLSGSSTLSKKLSRKKSSRAALASPLPPLPPGGLVEIAFSFDTTGSMSAALNEVKGRIKDIVQKLQSDVPGIRIAIFAHGDYCDKDNYIIKWIDFGATLPELHDFVNNCGDTGGGDGPECYELVLRRATEVLSWTPGSKRSLVIIGDDLPHEPGYKYGDFTNDIDWRNECTKLKDMGVKVYGVAVKSRAYAQKFYQELATRTDGLMITLENFNLIFDLMMSICYREGSDELLSAYQDELKEKYGISKLSKNLSGMFGGLSSAAGTTRTGLFGTSGGGLLGTPTAGGFGAPVGGRFGPSIGGRFGSPIIGGFAPPIGGGFVPPIGGGFGTPMVGGFGTPMGGGFGTPIGTGPFGTPTGGLLGMFGSPGAILKKGKTNKMKTTKTTKLGKKALIGKTPKTAAKGSRKENGKQKRKDNQNDIPREKRNDRKFKTTKPLNLLQWSSWKQAMSNAKLSSKEEWAKWLNGYVTKQIFARDIEDAAVYEFAVQPPNKKKKYPVTFSVVSGLPSSGKWCKQLVGRKHIREKLKQAIAQNAKVFVRRGKFKKRNKKFMEKVRKHLAKSNYPFGCSKKNARVFKIKDFIIS
ncbi:uncharacterized protein LOC127709713 [Mytilus californianus]|uniref:uncharacterized protein LOC127709713 n=1 Tax=Mytilus californianus TaxID=6549 RepID=UPI0022450E96|nr:uncharacterized protein LOC127709713 [Mytilus californianus]